MVEVGPVTASFDGLDDGDLLRVAVAARVAALEALTFRHPRVHDWLAALSVEADEEYGRRVAAPAIAEAEAIVAEQAETHRAYLEWVRANREHLPADAEDWTPPA
jgi:glutamate/tyrosine decarboxylase-like PLP-dependent enzyme